MTATVVLFDGRSTFLEPRRLVTLDAAQRRSKLVRLFRYMLLLAMAGIIGSVGFLVISNALAPPVTIQAAAQDGVIRMVNPRFTGRDSGGAPFIITARTAERPDGATTVTELAFPQFNFSGEESPSSMVIADRGVYDQDARTLDLYNGVKFRTDSGYSFETEHARVYIDDGSVIGERLISGSGPMGSLRAQSFEITDGGNRVLFRDNVVARLYTERRTPELRGQSEEAPAADNGDEASNSPSIDTSIATDDNANTGDESALAGGADDEISSHAVDTVPPTPEDTETP